MKNIKKLKLMLLASVVVLGYHGAYGIRREGSNIFTVTNKLAKEVKVTVGIFGFEQEKKIKPGETTVIYFSTGSCFHKFTVNGKGVKVKKGEKLHELQLPGDCYLKIKADIVEERSDYFILENVHHT